MPTYDYVCDACGHKFEHFQGINSEVLTKCPECRKKKLRRLFGTGAAIVFKGSGFYTTDYRSDSYKERAAADKKGEAAAASSSSDSKSDSKSETKAESTPAKSESKPAKSESKGKSKKE